MNMMWPILVVIAANIFYNIIAIIAKSTPQGISAWHGVYAHAFGWQEQQKKDTVFIQYPFLLVSDIQFFTNSIVCLCL